MEDGDILQLLCIVGDSYQLNRLHDCSSLDETLGLLAAYFPQGRDSPVVESLIASLQLESIDALVDLMEVKNSQ